MALDRKRQILLGGLAIALAVVIYRVWASPSVVPLPASNGTAATTGSSNRRPPQAAVTAPDVHLEKLDAKRPTPGETDRNLFRFKPKPPPPPAPPPGRIVQPPAPVPRGPTPPAPPPPITLKFIGLIGPSPQVPKIAVLSDGKGLPASGKEGDIILGQFRLIRIGAESVELSYLDGRGRQTIRLSGS